MIGKRSPWGAEQIDNALNTPGVVRLLGWAGIKPEVLRGLAGSVTANDGAISILGDDMQVQIRTRRPETESGISTWNGCEGPYAEIVVSGLRDPLKRPGDGYMLWMRSGRDGMVQVSRASGVGTPYSPPKSDRSRPPKVVINKVLEVLMTAQRIDGQTPTGADVGARLAA